MPWTMEYSARANSAHLGGGLSLIEIMAVLYGDVLRKNLQNPEWEDRDGSVKLSAVSGISPPKKYRYQLKT